VDFFQEELIASQATENPTATFGPQIKRKKGIRHRSAQFRLTILWTIGSAGMASLVSEIGSLVIL